MQYKGLIGIGHVGLLCLSIYPESRLSQERRYSALAVFFVQFRYTEPLILGTGENCPEIQVPRCKPEVTLPSRTYQGEQTQPAM